MHVVRRFSELISRPSMSKRHALIGMSDEVGIVDNRSSLACGRELELVRLQCWCQVRSRPLANVALSTWKNNEVSSVLETACAIARSIRTFLRMVVVDTPCTGRA